jgi:hypothetical protein
MSTDLEKYLKENRSKLDVESPDDTVIWKGIRHNLQKEGHGKEPDAKKYRLKRIFSMAAIILLVFSLGYITKDVLNTRLLHRIVNLSSISHDLGRRELEYRKLLDYKNDEVRSLTEFDNPVIRELYQEIKNLDLIYEQSIKDLNELGVNEKIINTIFDTYEKKTRLLELIILETNKINSHEDNEKINL